MKTFKQAAVVIATVGMVSMQAHAGETAVKSATSIQPMAAFSQNDINGLFDQADKPIQLAALSKQEMKDTEGAFAWFAPLLPYIPAASVALVHYAPRMGVVIDRIRHGNGNWRPHRD